MRLLMSLLILIVLPSVNALSAQTVNFSGKWVIEGPSRGQMRQPTAIVLILNQVGNEVTGSISAGNSAASASPTHTEILDGKVEGDTLTFYVWTGMDRPVKAYYKGTLAGEEIKFTVTGGAQRGSAGSGATQQEPRQLTAKRAK
jgi:hypothetical protein